MRCSRLLLIILCFGTVAGEKEEGTLKFVQILWRHGDRSPLVVLPNDEGNGVESWPNGLGELTENGIAQSFDTGQFLLQHYGAFVDYSYKSNKVLFLTASSNRTIMTAQSLLAGFFPPPFLNENWNPNLRWQPVPVHENSMIEQAQFPEIMRHYCPGRFNAVTESEAMLALNADNADLLQYFMDRGLIRYPSALLLNPIRDTMLCEYKNRESHRWPTWMNETLFRDLLRVDRSASLILHTDPDLLRLTGGWMLGELVGGLSEFMNGFRERRIAGYSAHDMNLVPLLLNLDVEEWPGWPDYNALLSLELRSLNSSFYFVQVMYRVNGSGLMEPLNLRGCSHPCPLEKFLSRAEPKMLTSMEQWWNICKGTQQQNSFAQSHPKQSLSSSSTSLESKPSGLKNVIEKCVIVVLGVLSTLLLSTTLLSLAWIHRLLRERRKLRLTEHSPLLS